MILGEDAMQRHLGQRIELDIVIEAEVIGEGEFELARAQPIEHTLDVVLMELHADLRDGRG